MKDWNYWQKRLTSYQFLMALSSLVFLILNNCLDIKVIPEQYNEIINSLLYVLVLGGVITDYPNSIKPQDSPDSEEDKKE